MATFETIQLYLVWKYAGVRLFVSVHAAAAAAAAKSRQSCLTPCDPIDGSPLGSPVPGILQARTLEWVAIAFSHIQFSKKQFQWHTEIAELEQTLLWKSRNPETN